MALQLSYLLSLLLLVLLVPYSTTAQTSSNQSLGTSLIAQETALTGHRLLVTLLLVSNKFEMEAIYQPYGSTKYLNKPLSGQPMEIIQCQQDLKLNLPKFANWYSVIQQAQRYGNLSQVVQELSMQPRLTPETLCWQARMVAICGSVLIIRRTQCYLHKQ